MAGRDFLFSDLHCTEEVLDAFARAQGIWEQKTDQDPSSCGCCRLGRVIKLDRTYPLVLTEDGPLRAEHTAELKKKARYLSAVGDWVALACPDGHDTPLIFSLLPRTHVLKRREMNGNEQVLAANVDRVFLMSTLSGEGVDIRHLERMLVVAHESGASAAIVLSKADEAAHLQEDLDQVRLRVGEVPVILESSRTGQGVEEVRALIPPGCTAVLLGKSGVGKSTLVNRLVGEDVLETGEVRESDGKGRHTTVSREMFLVPGGGLIIDAPGLRSIQIWDVIEGLDRAYEDVLAFADDCRFRDCTHTVEPGCGLVAAVERGELPLHRLESYRALSAEAAEARKMAEQARWR